VKRRDAWRTPRAIPVGGRARQVIASSIRECNPAAPYPAPVRACVGGWRSPGVLLLARWPPGSG
jgi:hypothetical protein